MIKLDFINIVTASILVELFFLFLFRFTNSPFTGKSINDWYTKFKWSAFFFDILIIVIGFYITKFIYKKYLEKKYKNTYLSYLIFLLLLLFLQIIHDILFYILAVKPIKPNMNIIMDQMKSYARKVSYGAIIGDSAMYILGVLLLIILNKLPNEINIILSLLGTYICGYFLYQKPLKKYQ